MADFELFTSIRYDPNLLDTSGLGKLATTDWNRKKPSPWYMLDYHRDRMLRAASHFGWENVVERLDGPDGLKRLEDLLGQVTAEAGSAPQRVKILLSRDGNMNFQHSPVPHRALESLFPDHLPKPSRNTEDDDDSGSGMSHDNTPTKQPEYEILIDSDATTPNEFTHYKTTRRQMYDNARKRHQLSLVDLKEVLLVNSNDGSIMEGSFTTPYFWRNGRWVTPPVSRGFRDGEGSGGNDGTSRRWALERGLVEEEIVFSNTLQNGEDVWLSTGVRGFVYGRLKC